ncbi:MAG: F0F1 ATP synthase subunit delta [Candidatus Accumulibacter sp.]|jgi:F-type H+-transporting ATPase subunit delta|nr:F0F1 ATP synthase subunit delta [Accumulibacter sp.]
MAESVTIARPYAQAIFRLAREGRSLTAWSERLRRLAAIVQDPEMDAFIGNPKFSIQQLADLFLDLSGEPENRELASFIGLLAENRRFTVLAEVSAIFEALKSEDEGVRDALIVSAFPINKHALAALLKQLEAHFGGRLQGRVEVDPALIGGVRVTVGDRIFDASVRGKLDAMTTALKN